MTAVLGGSTYLSPAAATALNSPLWALRSLERANNVTMVSNGYTGGNDGWQDLYVNNPDPLYHAVGL